MTEASKPSHLAFAALLIMLPSTAHAASKYLDTRWTRAAEAKDAAADFKHKKVLPELRVYDEHHRLVYRKVGFTDTVGTTIVRALRSGKFAKGPTFSQTMNELETRNGKPALRQAIGQAKATIVDYWADWCEPCKRLGKELDAWAAKQPSGAFEIVRAETDPMAAARRRGDKIYKIMKGPDGKTIKTEMK